MGGVYNNQWMQNVSTYAIPSCMSMCCRMLLSGGRESFEEQNVRVNDRIVNLLDMAVSIPKNNNFLLQVVALADDSLRRVVEPSPLLHAGVHCSVLVVLAVFATISKKR